jgi:type IV pilus assembly protein PilX
MRKNLMMPALPEYRAAQRGVSLIIVMIVLTVVSLLGVAGIQISTLSERGARNDRDQQIAWQSAEAALLDAEFDMFDAISTRSSTFVNGDTTAFLDGCAASGSSKGLCTLVSAGKPSWLTVDFDAVGASASTTGFGDFTGRTFNFGSQGIQPAKAPRYVIEPILDHLGGGDSRSLSTGTPKYVYRVTAMGFGPRPDIQAVVQMIFRD